MNEGAVVPSPRPLRFAVIGFPLAHTQSPAMHTAAYRELKLPHSYGAVRATRDELPHLFASLRDGVYAGFNVTVPHKKSVLELVDEIDSSAAMAEAANTIVRDVDGRLRAFNTDTGALADELRDLAPERGPRWQGQSALVLGTGGAARAAVIALAVDLGVASIHVRGRRVATDETAHALTALVRQAGSTTTIVTAPLEADREIDATVSAVVQATSAGMTGADSGEALTRAIDFAALGDRAVALDVVYSPSRTPFLHAAEARGLRSTNGLGMLARQGARAFELWLKVPAPYAAMRAAIT